MKFKLIIAILIATLPVNTNAQLGGLVNKIKSKVNQRTKIYYAFI